MIKIAIPEFAPCNNYINAVKEAAKNLGDEAEVTLIGFTGEECPADAVISLDALDASRFDGLLLPGGVDIHPSRYHQENTGCEAIDEALDALQFAVLDAFIRVGKPVFGICRGHQLLLSYFGGTLIQDIPERDLHTRINGVDNVHTVTALPGSFLAEIYGETFVTNSSHHQAAGEPGDAVEITAFSDGVAEALEHRTLPVKSVQFHPERMMLDFKKEGIADGEKVIAYFLKEMIPAK